MGGGVGCCAPGTSRLAARLGFGMTREGLFWLEEDGEGVLRSSGMVAGGPGVFPASCVWRAISRIRARLFSE